MTFLDSDHPEDLGDNEEAADVMRETGVRYAAYTARFGFLIKKAGLVAAKKTSITVSKVRHLAYTSDLGEAFRPMVAPW